MITPDSAGSTGGSSSVAEHARRLTGVLLTLAVAWSTPLRQVSPDTKTDLYVDPVGFMARALNLWDPQVTWGVLQNQGYGYLFPMGPFFAGVGSVLPMWVAQRLWWSLLLLVGYFGMLWLLRELGVRAGSAVHLAALAYVLAPRVITTIGGLSSEALPSLLAPLVLAPLVAASNGNLGPRRAAALSGLAVLGCGGINATATLLAAVPAGVWLISRTSWWRNPLSWYWAGALLLATAWWAVPLLLLGRYSPPFLDWIENARMVAAPVGLFDVIRGTSHWLGHLITPQGPWWPAGYELATDPWLILSTALVAGLGLAGIARWRVPNRGFLVALLVIGIVIIALPHEGPISSPLAEPAQTLLDGVLSPFRNVHKADPLVRLALCVGLAHLLSVAARARLGQRAVSSGLVGLVAISVVWSASPGMDGHLAPRGTFAEMPQHWRSAAAWLTENAEGRRSLIVPAANFGEYTWGRPLDEPVRPMTDQPYAVRDAVPLTPANTVRFLDAVERRLQTGRDVSTAVTALADLGVGYLVLRNDLDVAANGVPPVMFTRSAIEATPSLRLVARFGQLGRDLSGAAVAPVEIYELLETPSHDVEVWPASTILGASGASEALPQIRDAVGHRRPVVFDGDAVASLTLRHRVETDAYRARQAFFGFTRGQDVTSSLSLAEDQGVDDYRPWADESRRSAVTFDGGGSVSASSSIATDESLLGLRPAHRPYAAFDQDSATAWLTFGDKDPELVVEFNEPVPVRDIQVSPLTHDIGLGGGYAAPSRIRVETDFGAVTHDLALDIGSQLVQLGGAPTRRIGIQILETVGGEPGSTLTGLAEVTIPGVQMTERIRLANPGDGRTEAILLGAGAAGGSDGCLRADEKARCISGQFRAAETGRVMHREVSVSGSGEFRLSGTLSVNPLHHHEPLLLGPEIAKVSASSVRALSPLSAPSAAFDQDGATAWSPDPNDSAPRLTAVSPEPVTVSGVHVQARDRWMSRNAAFVQVSVDGNEQYGRLDSRGRLRLEPMTGRTVTLTFLRDSARTPHAASLEIEEIRFDGADWSAPPAEVTAPCGEGPELRVNDVVFPTRLTGSRAAALGFGRMDWDACVPVGLGFLDSDRISIEAWEGMSPTAATITRVPDSERPGRPVGEADTQGLDVYTRLGPAEMTGLLPEGPQRLLVMSDNANPGWTATVEDGTRLEPVTVDGFRQGFVVPEGVHGALSLRFEPNAPYRLGLAVGLGLALLLLPLALLPDRARVRPGTRTAQGPVLSVAGRVVLALPITLGVVLAGWVGGLLGVMATAVSLAFGRRPNLRRVRVMIVTGLILSAGLVEAVGPSADLAGEPGEAVTRLLVLLAVVVAVGRPAGLSGLREGDSSAQRPPG